MQCPKFPMLSFDFLFIEHLCKSNISQGQCLRLNHICTPSLEKSLKYDFMQIWVYATSGYKLCRFHNMISLISKACRWLDWHFLSFCGDETELWSSYSIQLYVGNASCRSVLHSSHAFLCLHVWRLEIVLLSHVPLRMSINRAEDWARSCVHGHPCTDSFSRSAFESGSLHCKSLLV